MNTFKDYWDSSLGFLKKLLGVHSEYESHIHNLFVLTAKHLSSFKPLNILDVGCADGSRTLRMAKYFMIPTTRTYGLDINKTYIDQCRNLFHVEMVDLEIDRIPYEDEKFDLVVCNQVLEHLKNYNKVLEEIIRVTKPGGYIMIGIPNLAHLINRFYLLFGTQPMCLDINSSHVRGFTHKSFKQKLTSLPGIYYIDSAGSELIYPLPLPIARPLSKTFKGLCAYICYLARKDETNPS